MCKRYPHHAQYINVFIALAPVAWVSNIQPILLVLLAKIDPNNIFSVIGYDDFLPSLLDMEDVCVFCRVCCSDIIGSIVGPNTE